MTYVWRFRAIRFNGLSLPKTKDRVGKRDYFDIEFESKEAFDAWYQQTTISLATLDQPMNFCKYFIRAKGNEGHYVREGKSFPVDGSWVGIQDFDANYAPTQPFVRFLEENGWRNDWFELMDRYKALSTTKP